MDPEWKHPTTTAVTYWPILRACMIDNDDCGKISEMNLYQVKPKYSEKICPSAGMTTADLRYDLPRARTREDGDQSPELWYGQSTSNFDYFAA
jgi:hypothetical protein